MSNDVNVNEMMALQRSLIEASGKEAEAKMLAVQASNRAEAENKRLADANIELVNSVKHLVVKSADLLVSLDNMGFVAENIDEMNQVLELHTQKVGGLIAMVSMVVGIVSKAVGPDERAQMGQMMHELAMSATDHKNNLTVTVGGQTTVGDNLNSGNQIIGDGQIQ